MTVFEGPLKEGGLSSPPNAYEEADKNVRPPLVETKLGHKAMVLEMDCEIFGRIRDATP